VGRSIAFEQLYPQPVGKVFNGLKPFGGITLSPELTQLGGVGRLPSVKSLRSSHLAGSPEILSNPTSEFQGPACVYLHVNCHRRGFMLDTELLARYARRRDAEAFALLVQRHQRLIFAACRRQLHDPADVDDAMQETFLRLAKSAGTLRSNVGGWLHRSATHVSTDLNRRRQTRVRYEFAAPPAGVVSPDQRELMEMREQLDMSMEKLNDEDRELIVQRFFAGRPQIELAAEAGVAASTISQRLDRAIERLRQHMGTAGCAVAATTLIAGLEKEAASAVVPAELTAKLTSVGLTGMPAPVGSGPLTTLLIWAGAVAALAIIVAALMGFWSWNHPPAPTAVASTLVVSPTVSAAATGGSKTGLTVSSGGNSPSKSAPHWTQATNAANDSPLFGHVFDRVGKPIEGAWVTLRGATNISATTDAQGQYAFDPTKLHDGQCELGASADGFLPIAALNGNTPQLLLSMKTDAVRDFVLDRGVVITVDVQNDSGDPLPNADVDVYGPDNVAWYSDRVRTDRDGTAEITLPPSQSPSTIAVSVAGYAPMRQKVTPASVDQPIDLPITMPVGMSVPGIAICANGKPAGGWQVIALPRWMDEHLSLSGAEINNDGRFTLQHIVPGDYQIEILKRDIGYGEYTPIGMFTLPVKGDGRLKLAVPGPSKNALPSLTGLVRLDGSLTYGLDVMIYSNSAGFESGMVMIQQGGFVPAEKTQAGLPFTIRNVPAGIYEVRFQGSEIPPTMISNVKVPGDPLIVDIKAPGVPHLRGTVFDPAGKPVTHFAVRVRRTGSLDIYSNYTQGADWVQVDDPAGRFEVELAGSGIFQAQVSADGYAWCRGKETRAELGTRPETVVRLTTGGSVRGTVVDMAGHPVAGAKVIPLSKSEQSDRFAGDAGAVLTAHSGRFQLDHLVAGEETLKISATNFTPLMTANLKIVENQTTDAGRLILHSGGSVEGIAYDRNGRPAPGLTVEFQDDQYFHHFENDHAAHLLAASVTDSAGHFRADHLPAADVYMIKPDTGFMPRSGVVQQLVHPIEDQTIRCDLGGTTPVHGRLILHGKPVADVGLTLSIGQPDFGKITICGKTGSDGRFTFFGPPPGEYTLFRYDEASMNREMLLGVFKIGPGNDDIGNVVQDTGDLVINLTADEPAQLAAVDDIAIERSSSGPWYEKAVGSAGRASEDGSVWRAKDVPAGPLMVNIWMKGQPRWVFKTAAERKPGADTTSVTVHIGKPAATLEIHVDNMLLRSDDGRNEISIFSEDSKPSTVLVPPGIYRVIDGRTD
jgi:RNA polymerase sigma factor (sigma-70 family)